MANYVSKDGLLYFWTLLKTKLESKSDTGHKHVSTDVTDLSTAVKGIKVDNATTADTANNVAWANTNHPSTFTPSTHNQGADTINSMTNYSKANSFSAIATSDSLNTAIGKLEKGLDTKQSTLSTAQQNAINSGITSTKVSTYDGYATTIAGKQASLSTAQLNACNSGITSTKVSTYDGYATTISGKANANDVYTKSEIDSKLTSAMRYKGSVATKSALPTTNVSVGDMYNVTATGANYVWDGSAWDETGMVIDLSPYAKTSDLVAVTNSEIDTIVAS